MSFEKSKKQANSHHPQICVLVIDDSGSMAEEGKCKQVTEAVQDMVTSMQSLSLGTHGFRFLLNICKFGDAPTELAVAKTPMEVDVDKLLFKGTSGGTEMLPALKWAESALKKSQEICRKLPVYQEELSPNPMCVFLSDGENTGADPTPAAESLRSIPFKDGAVDVFAVGVGMRDEHFQTMRAIGSRPDYAIKIESEGIADFLGKVGATVIDGIDVANLAAKSKSR